MLSKVIIFSALCLVFAIGYTVGYLQKKRCAECNQPSATSSENEKIVVIRWTQHDPSRPGQPVTSYSTPVTEGKARRWVWDPVEKRQRPDATIIPWHDPEFATAIAARASSRITQ